MVSHVPFGDIKLRYHSLKAEIDAATARVLESGHYILGPELERFEANFARTVGVEHAVGCASGTEAIYLALAAAGVGSGDEVITVAHTAVPTISAISMTGATPVFVDIDPRTYVMDVSKVAEKITSKTKAIVPVHLYGQAVDMEPLMELADSRGIPVIEDIAQATLATYKKKQVGTIGQLGAYSFYPSKNLGAFGDGGAVVTNSRELHEKLIRLRNYGQSKRYHHDSIGINSRLDEIQCAILSAQLPMVPKWNERRKEIASRYSAGLHGHVIVPFESPFCGHVYHLYVIQSNDRDGLQKYLAERGIHTLIHYPIPAHQQKAYQYLGYKSGSLPVTETITKRILSLPMFPELANDQIDYVIQEVREYHTKNPSAQIVYTASVAPVA